MDFCFRVYKFEIVCGVLIHHWVALVQKKLQNKKRRSFFEHIFSSIGLCFPILNGRKSLFNLSLSAGLMCVHPHQIYILWCQIWQRAASLLVFNFFSSIYIFKKQPFANFDVRTFLLNITHYWQQSDGFLSMQCNGKEHDMHLSII